MDANQVRAAWERAARRVAEPGAAPEGVLAPESRDDVPTFMEAPVATCAEDLEGAVAVVLGIPSEDGGSARRPGGVAEGPAAIRRQSAACCLRRGRELATEAGRDLAIVDRLRVVDYGDVAVSADDVETTFTRAHDKLADIVAAGAVPIVFGGDHSTPVPVLQVLSGKLSGKLGIVAFDARFDLSYAPTYGAGSQWARAFELGVVEPANFVLAGIRDVRESLLDKCVADELGLRYYSMTDVDELGIATVAQEALESAGSGTEAVYVSVDVGVVDPGYGGQTCADDVGLSGPQLVRALRTLATGRIAGFDICCLAPRRDLQGQLARLAARTTVEIVAGLAAQRP